MSSKDAFVAAVPEDDFLIKNPDNPSHLMVIKPVAGTVRVERNGVELAVSADAVRVMEIGRSVYDPMVYLPEADLTMALEKIDKSSHCPLKGDTEYFDINAEDGPINNAAWSYHTTIEIADALRGYVGFDTRLIEVQELTVTTSG